MGRYRVPLLSAVLFSAVLPTVACNELGGIDRVYEDPCFYGCGDADTQGSATTSASGSGGKDQAGGAGGAGLAPEGGGGTGGSVGGDPSGSDTLWWHVVGDSQVQLLSDIAVDETGVVLVGELSGTMDFGGAVVAVAFDEMGDAFAVKLDAQGHHVWSDTFGSAAEQQSKSVALAPGGDVVLAAQYDGVIDFGGPKHINYGAQADIALGRLASADGSYVWSQGVACSAPTEVDAVAVGPAGDAAFVGTFEQEISFGNTLLSSAGNGDIFVAQVLANGSYGFRERLGGPGDDHVVDVAVDSAGGIILAGWFTGSTNLGDGETASLGGADAFVAKLDSDGAFAWALAAGDAWSQRATATAVGASNEVFVAGQFRGLMDLGKPMAASGTSRDGFIVRLGGDDGSHVWSRCLPGTGDATITSMAVAAQGRLLVAGTFFGDIDLGAGTVTSSAEQSAFAALYDLDGALLWSHAIGATAIQDVRAGLWPNGDVTLAGTAVGDLDFGSGPEGSGDPNVFVVTFDTSGPVPR